MPIAGACKFCIILQERVHVDRGDGDLCILTSPVFGGGGSPLEDPFFDR